MHRRFDIRDGAVIGWNVREGIRSLGPGQYVVGIERVDRDKRSNAANRLMFGAFLAEMERFSAEEGGGKRVSADMWHKVFKDACLPVIMEGRKLNNKRVRVNLPNGTHVYQWVGKDPYATSTTALDSAEFSRYLRLCADVAVHVHKYPHNFDFIDQPPNG